MHPRTAVPPGIQPLDPERWLFMAEDHAGQMALRDRLVAGECDALGPPWIVEGGENAAQELLETVADHLTARGLCSRERGVLRRPDGVSLPLDGPPMAVLGRLAPEDFLIMERPEGASEHLLTAGVLLFPAHWTLAEKIGKPLLRIHLPVPEYPGDLARRVQRFFDGVQVGRPLWRANWHFARTPEIATPMREAAKLGHHQEPWGEADQAPWLRVERQTVLRLPRTGSVVFGVRTLMSDVNNFTEAQWRGLNAIFAAMTPQERACKAPPGLIARAASAAAAA
ncbi:MAG: DUF3445 domain-containing protein [Pseudomonadota bacterium]